MNGIILINKPISLTSHQVINKIRKVINQKDVGHSGTLDPFADGLLLVAFGKSLKAIQFLEPLNKTYIATLKLGTQTNTGDLTGEVIEEKAIPNLNKDEISVVLNSFLGTSLQLPPMFSALKFQGKKLYEYARENIEIKREKRKIEIFQIKLLDVNKDIIRFEVTCSKGTYIRTLAEDISKKLDTVGHLISLTRTKIGDFSLSDAINLDELTQENLKIISLNTALKNYTSFTLEDAIIKDVKNGKRIKLNSDAERILILNKDEEALAIYQKDEEDYKIVRGLW